MAETQLIDIVIQALADTEGVPPEDLDFALYDYIDPDVLTELEDWTSSSWSLTFQVSDHQVEVTAGGAVVVDGKRYQHNYRAVTDGSTPVQGRLEAEHQHAPDTVSNPSSMAYRCRVEPAWPMDLITGDCRGLTGYEPSALIVGGVSYGRDITHPEDQDDVWSEVTEALQSQNSFTTEYRIQTADDNIKEVWQKGVGVFDEGEAVGCVGFITDLTN